MPGCEAALRQAALPDNREGPVDGQAERTPTATRLRGRRRPASSSGGYGYPKVSIGPMVPPVFGDTTIMDTPEQWLGRPIETIVDYRYSLVRGNMRARVEDAASPSRQCRSCRSSRWRPRPVDTELKLSEAPRKILTLSEDTQPYGPSAPMEQFQDIQCLGGAQDREGLLRQGPQGGRRDILALQGGHAGHPAPARAEHRDVRGGRRGGGSSPRGGASPRSTAP